MKAIFIRHGMTRGNEERRYIGTTDEPLSKKGIDEIKRKRYPDCDIVVSSPMKRCLETAKLIYPDKKAQIYPQLRECDFGEFENKNYIELSGNADYQKWIDSNGTMPFPGGESMEEMKKRCRECFFEILKKYPDKTVAFVVHGGTVMAIMRGEDFYDYQIKNGEFIERNF